MGSGGIWGVASDWMKALHGAGYEIDLFVLEEPETTGRKPPSYVTVHKGGIRVRSSLSLFVNYLRTHQPDVIVAARVPVLALTALALQLYNGQCKFIATTHTNWTAEAEHVSLVKMLYYKLGSIALQFADRVVAVSEGVAEDISRWSGVTGEDVIVIPNAAWGHSKKVKMQGAPDHPWLTPSRDYKVIVSVGRFCLQKDFETLLIAFANVIKEKDVRLLIYGDGRERKKLISLANRMGLSESVSFPGYANNVLKEIKAADMFVLSSRWEGFGNVLVEALGAGLPIVSTDCPSGPSEILGNGKYGMLVPVGNPEAMSEAILKSLHCNPDTQSLKSRAESFTFTQISGQYVSVVDTIVNN